MLKLANLSRDNYNFWLHPVDMVVDFLWKTFRPRHEHNLYSCYWLGSSLVPGNLISDEMIKFREEHAFFCILSGRVFYHLLNSDGILVLLVRTGSFF